MVKIGNTTLGGVTIKDGSSSFLTENTARKEAFLTPLPLFGMNSNQTDVFDFGGVIKTITLLGKYEDNTGALTGIKNYIDAIEALIDGDQSSVYQFIDDLRGTLNVKIESFESTLVEATFALTWTLRIIESSTNG